MKAVFEIDNSGACGAFEIILGVSGRAHTFQQDPRGGGFKLKFEGTPKQYSDLMKDILGARRRTPIYVFPEAEIADKTADRELFEKAYEDLRIEKDAVIADLQEKLSEKISQDQANQVEKSNQTEPAQPTESPEETAAPQKVETESVEDPASETPEGENTEEATGEEKPKKKKRNAQ